MRIKDVEKLMIIVELGYRLELVYPVTMVMN
jgi:hypothetical protein